LKNVFQFIVENVSVVLMRRYADCQTDGHKSSSHAFMPFTAIYTFMNVQVNLMALKKYLHQCTFTIFRTPRSKLSLLLPLSLRQYIFKTPLSRKLNYFIKPGIYTYTTAVRSLMMQASRLETSSLSSPD
jgi:hypothetical protein